MTHNPSEVEPKGRKNYEQLYNGGDIRPQKESEQRYGRIAGDKDFGKPQIILY
jgi:hypothetical protein